MKVSKIHEKTLKFGTYGIFYYIRKSQVFCGEAARTHIGSVYHHLTHTYDPYRVPVLGIRDILVRILGSVPLTNRPGCGSGRPKKIYGSYGFGSGSPTLIRTYIARLEDPYRHSFRFPDPDTLLLEFCLKGSGSTFIFVERVLIRLQILYQQPKIVRKTLILTVL